jgi:hypothetical protein
MIGSLRCKSLPLGVSAYSRPTIYPDKFRFSLLRDRIEKETEKKRKRKRKEESPRKRAVRAAGARLPSSDNFQVATLGSSSRYNQTRHQVLISVPSPETGPISQELGELVGSPPECTDKRHQAPD